MEIVSSRKDADGVRVVDIARSTSAPAVTDDLHYDFAVGSLWERMNSDGAVIARYECSAVTSGAAVWNRLALTDLESIIIDPGNAGAIPVTKTGSCKLVSAGAETRTLAIPTFVGQRLTLYLDTDGGDIVITSAQRINVAGNTSITFNDASDILKLEAITIGGDLRWQVVLNTTTTLG